MRRLGLIVVAVLILGALPATASWLVLRDGQALPTSGPWEIGDNEVTYAQPDGRRIAVMLVVVDPEATRLANVPGAPPPAANSQGAPRKRFVISNETVKKSKSANGARERSPSAQDISSVLTTIAVCLTRFPDNAADYTRCCAAPH